MNKLVLLIVACALLVSTVGATATASATPIGHAPLYYFDVTYNGKTVGQVIVNTAPKTPTYVLVARGLTRSTTYTVGYTDASGDVHPLGTATTAKAGALATFGTFPAADVKGLQSAQFWVTETPPGSPFPIRGYSLLNEGWFVAKVACDYSTDGGATWHRSDHSGPIYQNQEKKVDLGALGVPNGALVKIYVIVVAGKSKEDTGPPFQYISGAEYYARYWIYGTTLSNTLYWSGYAS